MTGREVRFAAVTIERWYYTARRRHDDPVAALRRAVRKDCGKVSLAAALAEQLGLQYREYPHWSYQLHYDNLAALVKADPSLGRLPSYSTVKRYMQAHGLVRKPRLQPASAPARRRAEARRQTREIRSYEAEYVGSLWHLDFHHGSLKVLTSTAASGCARSRWASSMTTRDCAATSSGTSRRPPRTWSTDSPRRSRNAVCPVLS